MDFAQNVLLVADRYARHRGLALASVSRMSASSGHFFRRLAADETAITNRRYARILSWFSVHWPEDLEWPAEVERPNPAVHDMAAE